MTNDSILPVPDIFSAKRILCIQPHYDDNDIAAAGTLALLQQNGAELFYVTATDDLMGVVDVSLSDKEAALALKRDQLAAGEIVGVKEQYWCGYPDAGDYDYFALRRDFLKFIRMIQPDFVFTADPWLTYEAHRDHIQTGLAASEAVMFAALAKIASSDTEIDSAYKAHKISGVAFYFTREPNYITDVSETWEKKVSSVQCYEAQFEPPDMQRLIQSLDVMSERVAKDQPFQRGEPLKVLHPSALHCGV